MRLATLALALMLMPPVASAEDVPEPGGVPATARALAGGVVQLMFTLDDEQDPGDVLPICDDHDEPSEGDFVVGLVHESKGCFDMAQSTPPGVNTEDLPTTCDPVHGGVYLFPEPGYHLPDPDEDCIFGIVEGIISLVSDSDKFPVSIQVLVNR